MANPNEGPPRAVITTHVTTISLGGISVREVVLNFVDGGRLATGTTRIPDGRVIETVVENFAAGGSITTNTIHHPDGSVTVFETENDNASA